MVRNSGSIYDRRRRIKSYYYQKEATVSQKNLYRINAALSVGILLATALFWLKGPAPWQPWVCMIACLLLLFQVLIGPRLLPKHEEYLFRPASPLWLGPRVKRRFEKMTCEMKESGFQRIGDFLLRTWPKRVFARIFVSGDGRTFADISDYVYGSSQAYSFLSIFSDGVIAISAAVELAIPPPDEDIDQMHYESLPGASIPDLYRFHREMLERLAQERGGKVLSFAAGQFRDVMNCEHRVFNQLRHRRGTLAETPVAPPCLANESEDVLRRRKRNIEWKRWGLAASGVLTPVNQETFESLAFECGREAILESLRKWWNIDSLADLEKTLGWLYDEGHTAECLARCEELRSSGYIDPTADDDEPGERALNQFLLREYACLEKDGLVAWDLGRLVDVARCGYTAKYITADTAWDWIRRASQQLQGAFASWPDMGANFMLGYRFCNNPAEEIPTNWLSAYDWLLSSADSPWRKIPWDTPLDDA
jgi:hypothetical protein